MGINSKNFIIILYYTIPPKPQTTIGNDYIYTLLASTASASATAADS